MPYGCRDGAVRLGEAELGRVEFCWRVGLGKVVRVVVSGEEVEKWGEVVAGI